MDLEESCKIQDQVGGFFNFYGERNKITFHKQKSDYTVVLHSGQEALQGKKFKRSIKLFVKLKVNVTPHRSIVLCSELRLFP